MRANPIDYETATRWLIDDFAAKPEIVDRMAAETGSRFRAIQDLTEVVASNFVLPGETEKLGRVAQGLSDWHSYLAAQTSKKFMALTVDPEGPRLTREEANADPDLQTLQAVRRGVRAARRNYSRYAATEKLA